MKQSNLHNLKKSENSVKLDISPQEPIIVAAETITKNFKKMFPSSLSLTKYNTLSYGYKNIIYRKY